MSTHDDNDDNNDDDKFMIIYTVAELEDVNQTVGLQKLSQIMQNSSDLKYRYSGRFSEMSINTIKSLIERLISDKFLQKEYVKGNICVITRTQEGIDFGVTYISNIEAGLQKDPFTMVVPVTKLSASLDCCDNNEQYGDKLPREILLRWIFEGYSDDEVVWKYKINDIEGEISFGKNKIYVEYPVVMNDDFNSLNSVWDEEYDYKRNSTVDYHNLCTPSPTHEWCVKNKLRPEYVFDIAISRGDYIVYGIKIVNVHGTSTAKKYKVQGAMQGFCYKTQVEILEVSAEWILNQLKKPDFFVLERYITFNEDIMSNNHIKQQRTITKDNYVKIDLDELNKKFFDELTFYEKENYTGNEKCNDIVQKTQKECGARAKIKYVNFDNKVIYRCCRHCGMFDKVDNKIKNLTVESLNFLKCKLNKNNVHYVFDLTFNDANLLKKYVAEIKKRSENNISDLRYFQIVMKIEDRKGVTDYHMSLTTYDCHNKLSYCIGLLHGSEKKHLHQHLVYIIYKKFEKIIKNLNALEEAKKYLVDN